MYSLRLFLYSVTCLKGMDIFRYVFMTVNDFRPEFFLKTRVPCLCGRVGNVSVVILATLL